MSERRRRLPALALPGLALVAGFVLGRHGDQAAVAPAPDQERTRAAAVRRTRPGRLAAGGFFASWPDAGQAATVAGHVEFQYADLRHQTDTALAGMWLFLATEALFFGGLFLPYAVYRGLHPAAVAEASGHAELGIGTLNTVLLLTSSAVFAFGLGQIRRGRDRALLWSCIITAGLGATFLGLKGYEWKLDFDAHLFPGPGFGIGGPDAGLAQLFWSFYFIATALHGVHMMVGIGLVAWTARNTRRRRYTASYHTPVEIVGLYWSFVDMVWLMLYPAIYLVGSPR